MPNGGRVAFTLLSILFTSGALLLLFFTVLDGARTTNPLNKFWYLKAAVPSNSGINQPDGYSYWTNYNICGGNNGVLGECGPIKAAYGFDPTNQVQQAPNVFSSSHSFFYIASRVYYAFLLIGLFFTFVAWLTNLAGIFGRLGSFIAMLFAFLAFVFDAIAASLMTAVYVRGRKDFRDNGIDAHLGVKLFAFMWTVVALMLLCSLFYAIGICLPSKGLPPSSWPQEQLRREAAPPTVGESTYVAPSVGYESGLPRSSYERAGKLDGPIDSTTGATYVR
ncbi:SUR7 protein fmp45 [Savitreella phatthalungensis]